MLVLTRREGEDVVIDAPGQPRITVHVASIDNDRVRIGFTAPREIAIHRSEVAEEIEAQKVRVG